MNEMKPLGYFAMHQLFWLILFLFAHVASAASTVSAGSTLPLSLDEALSQAISASPEVAAEEARAQAEHSAIRARYSPENPRFGLMRESNMNFMEMQNGPMDLWSVSQEIRFPTKYFLSGSAQRARALQADEDLSNTRLKVRQKLISAYYSLFAADRVIALLEAQRETLREVARSAESRHATGSAPQQDEMKAHVEQTKIETDLITAGEEKAMSEASLNALMGRAASVEIVLPKSELGIPGLSSPASEIEKIALRSSRSIQAARFAAQASESGKSLAAWEFAPDFMVSYKKAYANAPSDAYEFSVEMSIPLWFFLKQTSEYSSASAQALSSEKALAQSEIAAMADVKSLLAKVLSHENLLKIYQTSLIPQATTTLGSSRAAYQAGRTSFLEMLDSERSLYAVRIAYYRTLAEYVDYLTTLEQTAGAALSALPMASTGDIQ